MSKKISWNTDIKRITTSVTELLMCIVGTFMYALAVSLFVTPLKFAAGGVTGLGILVNYLVPFVSTGTFVFVANIPLFILAWRKFGFRFIARGTHTGQVLPFFHGQIHIFQYPYRLFALIVVLTNVGHVHNGH